jgi:predicted DNA-binding protein YlxM (UPF0122 family)
VKVPDEYYHMTLQEVADEMGITRQAVHDTERRALRKLREFHGGQLCKILAITVELRRSRERDVARFERTLRSSTV